MDDGAELTKSRPQQRMLRYNNGSATARHSFETRQQLARSLRLITKLNSKGNKSNGKSSRQTD